MGELNTTIREVAEVRGLIGGPFGSSLVGTDYTDDGIPVIRGTNLNHGQYIAGPFAYVSEEKANTTLARNQAAPADIIFTQRGTLGQVAIVPEPGPDRYIISQSQMRLRVDPVKAIPKFVYYACKTASFQRQIAESAISTGVPHINLGILSRLTIPTTPIETQQAIAEVLGALDDKIAANTNLATTADELVRAWYMGTSASADSTATIAELATQPRTLIAPSEFTKELAYVGLEHVPRRQMWLNEFGTAESVTSTKTRFTKGDALFGKLRPYFHKVVAAPFDGVSSTDILVVRASDTLLKGFLLAALASDAVVERCAAASEGTRMPRTSWATLSSVEVPWPGEHAARAMSQQIDAVRDRVEAALAENRTLAATRDALLPALMSGTLRVRDAERVVESVL